jgi:rhodanese-related sulfurtransferase
VTAGYAGDLTPREAWDILAANPKAVLLDVRTQAEWNFVGVPDTSDLGRPPIFVEWTSYPDGELNHRFVQDLLEAGVEPSADAPVIFICRSGVRSVSAATAATEAGIGPSYNVLDGFEGGMNELGQRGHEGWRAAGLPWHQA